MIKCVDKYDVREYVKSKGLENILIPCYGVYDSVDEVNWEKLPSRFVLKDTLGSGGNSVVVINGTEKIDIDKLKERAKEWTLIDEHRPEAGREWPYYSGKKHRILIEEYLEAENDDIGLVDYKFFCFDGVVKWVYVIADRVIGKGAAIGIFNEHFVKQKVSRNDERPLDKEIVKPKSFELMKTISEQLSAGFPEARIDLYDIKGQILFGEITFFDGSGYMTFTPDSFDEIMGNSFILPEII